jgi:eukaryotic-like serine/threonine-protein kinase
MHSIDPSPEMNCLSRETLAAFDLGKLSEAELEQVASHLNQCSRCSRELYSLQESDQLLLDLRRLVSPDRYRAAERQS